LSFKVKRSSHLPTESLNYRYDNDFRVALATSFDLEFYIYMISGHWSEVTCLVRFSVRHDSVDLSEWLKWVIVEGLLIGCAVWVDYQQIWTLLFDIGNIFVIWLYFDCLTSQECPFFCHNVSMYIIYHCDLQVAFEVVLNWFLSTFSMLHRLFIFCFWSK
jgi:hypothetical protein